MYKLRDYQSRAVFSCVDFLMNGDPSKRGSIMVAPTAAGKSIIVAEAARALKDDGRVLCFQPSKELLEQNFAKYQVYDRKAAIYSASMNSRRIAPVTFATIGTAKSNPGLFKTFKYLLVDEAHLFPPAGESMFTNFLNENPQLRIIGMTATPFRLQNMILGSILKMLDRNQLYSGYSEIIQIPEVRTWWTPIQYYKESQDQSILKIKSNGSDFTDESLDIFAMAVRQRILDAIKYYGDRPKLISLPSIDACTEMSKQVPGSAVVSSKTDKKTRERIIADFKSKKIRTVFNVHLLGVGFDFPELEILIDAVPTLSLARYYQKVGRLTRVHENKKESTYIDFSGNVERFGKVEDLMMLNVKGKYDFYSGKKRLTSSILSGQFQVKTPAEFVNIEIPWGKHKGKLMTEIPPDYLKWLAEECSDKKIAFYANHILTQFYQP